MLKIKWCDPYFLCLFIFLLVSKGESQSVESGIRLNRYLSTTVASKGIGLESHIEKYIQISLPDVHALIIEILRGSGLQLVEPIPEELSVRLKQEVAHRDYIQKGELGVILHHIMGEAYQIIYDPVHAVLSFRVKPRLKKNMEGT